MIESTMIFLREIFSNPLRSGGYSDIQMLFLVLDFPAMFLSLIFYQLSISERISKKQLFLNNINIIFIIVFFILLFQSIYWKYSEIIVVFIGFIPSLVFLYLKIFKKHNYVFFNLVNYWWILFWCMILGYVQYLYGAILVYLIVFFYKQMLILILLFINITGLYLLHFYNIYIFNKIMFHFVILFPFILLFFSFGRLIFLLFKENNETELDKFNTNKKIHKEKDKDKDK